MKQRFFILIALFAFFALAGIQAQAQSTPEPTLTSTPTGSYVRIGAGFSNIYVRGGPGEVYFPVGRLNAGSALIPLNRNASGTWILIAYNSGFGWIRRDLGIWVEDLDALPILPETSLTPTAQPQPAQVTPFVPASATPIGNWLNVGELGAFVRSGPDYAYDVIGTLDNGVLVEPVGRNEDEDWILIRYNDGFAWIARSLVRWQTDLYALPVLPDDNLTPTPTFTSTDIPTVTPTDTATATETVTSTATATTTSTATPTDTATATSTDTAVPTATETVTATLTETSTVTATDIPTSTHSPTETATNTATVTETATETATSTATATDLPTETPTQTATDLPTETATNTATVSPTETFTLTATETATATSTATVTETPPVPTETATATATVTDQPTETATPTETPTMTVTFTETAILINTATNTVTPSETPTATSTQTETATDRSTVETTEEAIGLAVGPSATVEIPTVTASPSATITETATSAVTATLAVNVISTQSETSTETGAPGVAVLPTSLPPLITTIDPVGGDTLPLELIVGGVGLLAVIGYAGFYWRGLNAAERYADGFVVDRCPVCQEGELSVESRQERFFGIPRVRHTVRCDNCRSVLREAPRRRWRYAVDPLANPVMYEKLNGQLVDEETLRQLRNQPTSSGKPPRPRSPGKPPAFVDEE